MGSPETDHASMNRKYTSFPQSFSKSDKYGVQNHYICELLRMRPYAVLTYMQAAIK
jgi:hypothetical protein